MVGLLGELFPLGIQNSSITVYGRLLQYDQPSGRIRYYSFYCWLLDEYDRLSLEKKNKLLKPNTLYKKSRVDYGLSYGYKRA